MSVGDGYTFQAHTALVIDTSADDAITTMSLKIIDAHVGDDQNVYLLLDPHENG